MNRVVLVGNISGDIYFRNHLTRDGEEPILRVVLFSSRPQRVNGLRVSLFGDAARLYYPYLKKGSGIAVVGHIVTRSHRGKRFQEVHANQMLLLRKINYEYGEAERIKSGLPALDGNTNHGFVIGRVEEDIHYDWYVRSDERGGGQYAMLRIYVTCEAQNGHESVERLTVKLRGRLAEIVYPYLRTGSEIAVDGHMQTRPRRRREPLVELAARHILFVKNINWREGKKHTQRLASAENDDHLLDEEDEDQVSREN